MADQLPSLGKDTDMRATAGVGGGDDIALAVSVEIPRSHAKAFLKTLVIGQEGIFRNPSRIMKPDFGLMASLGSSGHQARAGSAGHGSAAKITIKGEELAHHAAVRAEGPHVRAAAGVGGGHDVGLAIGVEISY